MTRFVAIDWSGRVTGAAEFIWIAEARDGELVRLENGRTRAEVIQWLIDAAASGEELVAGLDFSFSLPGWYCRRRGWCSGPRVWTAMRDDGERLLADELPPFWGRSGSRPPALSSPQRALRRTERQDVPGAKSTFQIGGAGAVGTGSIRGMARLPALAAAGWAIWPFDPPARATAVEIYPGALYPAPVVKSRWRRRRAALAEWFADHPEGLIERAAGSEDAFDAAVSALIMAREWRGLPAPDAVLGGALEGCVWTPALRA